MTWRIGDRIVRGELNNICRNTVHGWLDLGGDCGIRLDLTGNFDGELAGTRLRFTTTSPSEPHCEDSDDPLDSLESQQIGPVGSMTLRISCGPQDSTEGVEHGLEMDSESDASIRIGEQPSLYLEWFGQNGRIVAEIINPELSWDTSKDTSDPDSPEPRSDDDEPDVAGYRTDENDQVEESPFSDCDDSPEDCDPYHLFSADLEQQIGESLGEPSSTPLFEEEKPSPISWDEVIPGIDEETKKLYEQWDEVVHGEKDEPLSTLFDPPMSLKRPDDIANEAEATELLTALLARLALHSVALDMCEHYTAHDAYRLLIEVILPEAQIHPGLSGTGFIQHYATWENCAECDAEYDAKHEGIEEDD